MQTLNLPPYQFKIRETEHQKEIFDSIRRKYVALTPEEWVRQNFMQYLVNEKKMPASLLAVEKSLTLNQLTKRTDIVLYSTEGKPVLIVECKAPEVKISQKVFEQISRYNLTLRVHYLVVTNGLTHYCAFIDFKKNTFNFLEEIPGYDDLER